MHERFGVRLSGGVDREAWMTVSVRDNPVAFHLHPRDYPLCKSSTAELIFSVYLAVPVWEQGKVDNRRSRVLERFINLTTDSLSAKVLLPSPSAWAPRFQPTAELSDLSSQRASR